MAVATIFPRLYPIVDAGLLASSGISLASFAHELRDAGIRFLQYRDKQGTNEQVLANAGLLRQIFPAGESLLILNDRIAVLDASQFDGVHIGQTDVPAALARQIAGPQRMIGLSTHTEWQLIRADASHADYVAVGPIFATSSKADPDPAIGLPGLRIARRLTRKPLVAIGGITAENCASVFEAGADSVAVISALVPPADGSEPRSGTAKRVADFLAQIA